MAIYIITLIRTGSSGRCQMSTGSTPTTIPPSTNVPTKSTPPEIITHRKLMLNHKFASEAETATKKWGRWGGGGGGGGGGGQSEKWEGLSPPCPPPPPPPLYLRPCACYRKQPLYVMRVFELVTCLYRCFNQEYVYLYIMQHLQVHQQMHGMTPLLCILALLLVRPCHC